MAPGGPACWIIINCGALKADAFSIVELYPKDNEFAEQMRVAGVRLGNLEDEICELGGEIEAFLTEAERLEITGPGGRGEQAAALSAELVEFSRMARHDRAAVEQDILTRLRAFTDEQHSFFVGLAANYKDSITP